MTSPSPRQPRVLVVAFQGWSDAGDATTEVLQHLASLIGAEVLHAIGAEGYVDFQVHRPRIVFDEDGARTIEWPDTRLFGVVERPGDPEEPEGETIRRIDGSRVTDLYLLAGVEPARDWQNYADEIVELVDVWGIDTVVLLGAMYSDAPHSRPIVTTLTSESPEFRATADAARSSYEGPAGIISVIELGLIEAGITPISLWAQVPHYVHSTPSPKATLALLDKLEELLDIVIPRGELLAQANEWEANINRIAGADEEMSRYIRHLEESRDEELAAGATGDAIALEFEKFLEQDRRPRREDADPGDGADADPGHADPDPGHADPDPGDADPDPDRPDD